MRPANCRFHIWVHFLVSPGSILGTPKLGPKALKNKPKMEPLSDPLREPTSRGLGPPNNAKTTTQSMFSVRGLGEKVAPKHPKPKPETEPKIDKNRVQKVGQSLNPRNLIFGPRFGHRDEALGPLINSLSAL